MESQKIYEESYNELVKIRKAVSNNKVTIDFSKLDTESASVLKQKLSEGLAQRTSTLSSIISGVK
jgi:hypothetical protein